MPDIDGLMLVRFFRANTATRDIPLIVIPTDYIDGSDAVVAQKIAPRLDEIITKLLCS